MKLQFDLEDIEQLLLEKAKQLGIDANRIDFDIGYGYIKGATASKSNHAETPRIVEQEAA